MDTELKKEQQYLQEVRNFIQKKIDGLENKNKHSSENVETMLDYVNTSKIDDIERAFMFNEINNEDLTQAETQKEITSNRRILKRPFFAKISVSNPNEKDNEDFYIGIKAVSDVGLYKMYVIDWRAPISSLYYTAELGPASYEVNGVKINQDLKQKRQYKYDENDKIVYFFDKKVNDEILIDILSKGTNSIMENIVQTIQAEQDEAIRFNPYKSMIINGIPGSGKTSVALHRIANILYICKNDIKNDNIIMISPNKTFVEYISNLLPELGEENVIVQTMDELLNKKFLHLQNQKPRVTFLNDVITGNTDRLEQYSRKYSYDFLKDLQDFLDSKIGLSLFNEQVVSYLNIPHVKIMPLFYTSKNHNLYECIDVTLDRIADKYFPGLKEREVKKLKNNCFKLMKDELSWEKLYSQFMKKNNMRDSLDIENIPIISYIKFKTSDENVLKDRKIKHIVIDEIQDYDSLSLQLLKETYPNAKFTLVGDHSQNILFEKSNADNLSKLFPEAAVFNLSNSYRSTTEIMNLAFDILGKKSPSRDIRHGKNISIKSCKNEEELICSIKKELNSLPANQRTALVVKNKEDANRLKRSFSDFEVLDTTDAQSFIINSKFIVTAFEAKGLEFDNVILYDISDKNYNSKTDQRLLYVATSRALHHIGGFSIGKPSRFISEKYIAKEFPIGTDKKNDKDFVL